LITQVYQTEHFNFEVRNKVLLASWHNSLNLESELFRDSVSKLFSLAATENIEHFFIDSGTPRGEPLPVEVISDVQNAIGKLGVRKIALLESVNFHWDNNLIQFLKYLKTSQNLTFEFKTFYARSLALEWLS
jgi:hypothetical protein